MKHRLHTESDAKAVQKTLQMLLWILSRHRLHTELKAKADQEDATDVVLDIDQAQTAH